MENPVSLGLVCQNVAVLFDCSLLLLAHPLYVLICRLERVSRRFTFFHSTLSTSVPLSLTLMPMENGTELAKEHLRRYSC